eukprot:jgi/Chrzof1/14726/Cz09g13170.t1
MATQATEYLERLQTDRPELADDVAELANLYHRKLWHQLTVKLEEVFRKPEFNKGSLPLDLYTNFISEFGLRINLLKLSQFAVHVAKTIPDPSQAIAFLQSVVDKLQTSKLPRSDQPILFLQMQVAQQKLETGDIQSCKVAIEAGKEALDSMTDVDPSISASVYYVSSLYYKAKHDYAEFYKSSMMYLAFVSSEDLPYDFKLPLAVDIALAALLGEHIYNFAQLLMHPIVKVLDNSPYQWLHELLNCFHQGDLHLYDELCKRHAAALNAQPALVENERRLREKITISCLMDLISSMPPEERSIPLSTIAQRTKLSIDGVEFLLMKALALHLIEGKVDQVEQAVAVSWVQPRILTMPQIQGLKDRLDGWISKVQAISTTLEQQSLGVAEA